MNQTQRQAILLELIQRLRSNGSWCGETHIQKSAYFLQELLGVPLDLNFIFYKHGPYSFDLGDEITALRADELLSVQAREPYGPTLLPTEQAGEILQQFPRTLKKYGPATEFVARRLGPKKVAELEQLATALYVLLQERERSREEQAREMTRLKPHVTYEEAVASARAVETMQTELDELPPA
jgi:hypothetical protein